MSNMVREKIDGGVKRCCDECGKWFFMGDAYIRDHGESGTCPWCRLVKGTVARTRVESDQKARDDRREYDA